MATLTDALQTNSKQLEALDKRLAEVGQELGKAQDVGKTINETDFGADLVKKSGLLDIMGSFDASLIRKALTPGAKLSSTEVTFLSQMDDIIKLLKGQVDEIVASARSAFEENGTDPAEAETRLKFLRAQLEGQVKLLSNVVNEDLNSAIKSFQGTVTGAFKDLALKGEFSAKKIGDAFVSTAFDLVAKKFIEKPLDSFFNAAFGSIFGRAGGGAVHAGVPVLVGERAPEVFVPHVPGRILNSNDSRRALSGGQNVTIHQNITFTTDVANSVRAEILNAAPAIASAATQSVINSLRGIRI